MRGGLSPRGYTIVEVMIFLAVSGFMFIIAAAFVSGKQSIAEFRQGMNEINTQVQQAINDVGNGFYPSGAGFACSANASGLTINGGGGSVQGANQGCVFLGKVIQFGLGGDGTRYAVYTVAGSQFANGAASGNPPASFAEALPTAVDDSNGGAVTNINLTQTSTLQWGLKATKMTDNGANVSAIGFMSSFAGQAAGSLASGSQAINAVTIPSPAVGAGDSEGAMVSKINGGVKDANVQAHPNILICFDGGAGQFGSLTIGGSGGNQRLATSVQITGSSPPAGC